MSTLCDPNINDVVIVIHDFIAMIDSESRLKIYGNTEHELAKLLMTIASTYVVFIINYDITDFDDNTSIIILLLSNNELHFVTLNTNNTYTVNKIIPKTKWISKIKMSRNRFYGCNEHNKIEIINTDLLRHANRETTDIIDEILVNENNVNRVVFIENGFENNTSQFCCENCCVIHTNYTLTFYGSKLSHLNESLKNVLCTYIYFYEYLDQNNSTDNWIHIHLLTIDKQYVHYKCNDKNEIVFIKNVNNVNVVNVYRNDQAAIRENEKPLHFNNNNAIPDENLTNIYRCIWHCYRFKVVKMCATYFVPNFKNISMVIFEDGFVFTTSPYTHSQVYDSIHVTDKTRPFTNTIIL